MVDDAEGVNVVEGRASEWKPLRVGSHEVAGQPSHSKIPPGERNGRVCEVNTHIFGAGRRKLRAVSSEAASDLENAFVREAIECSGCADERRFGIPEAFDVEKV